MRRKGYTIFSIVTALVGEAAIAAIILWLLPRWGVNIPMWGLIVLMLAFGVYQGVTYRIGKRALDRKPVVSPQAMVGCCGRAATPLAPDGYVQVAGELWRALSIGPSIGEGEEIIIVEVKRLTLFVAPLSTHTGAGEEMFATIEIDSALWSSGVRSNSCPSTRMLPS